MTILQLRYFSALAENLHYTKTAELLHISQPSLSYEIKKLEESIGASLFTIENRKVQLTPCGRTFLPYAKEALKIISDGEEKVREESSKGTEFVKLGYFHSISFGFVPDIIDKFYKDTGNRKIRFRFTDAGSLEILNDLKDGTIDIGFSLRSDNTLSCRKIAKQQLFLMLPSTHPLSEKESVSIEDFATERIVMLEEGVSPREIVEDLFSSRGIEPSVSFEVHDCNTALQYVTMGYGVSILPKMNMAPLDKIKAVKIIEKGECLSRDIYLCVNPRKALKAAPKEVLQFVEKTLK